MVYGGNLSGLLLFYLHYFHKHDIYHCFKLIYAVYLYHTNKQKLKVMTNLNYNSILTEEVKNILSNSVSSAKAEGNDTVNINSDEIISEFTDTLSTCEYNTFDWDVAENILFNYASSLF